MANGFVPLLDLSAGFYADVVEPLVRPWPHAAALLGSGSEVLGYDDVRSTDHDWGPRLHVFVADHDLPAVRRGIDGRLPESYRGWPTHYAVAGAEANHHVEVCIWDSWLVAQLGVNPRKGLDTIDWLTIPQQQILGVVRGRVFADPDGELEDVRDRLIWFPHDVWLWLLASQWTRIGQEDHLVGRTAEVGDEVGSRILASRITRELAALSFLLARRYRPYGKWLGTELADLPESAELMPMLEKALSATGFVAREDALVAAYELLAVHHNALGITERQDPRVRSFFDRPFRVLMAERFAIACRAAIGDPWLREVPLIGSVDQFVDSTDVLSNPDRSRHLRVFFEALAGRG